MKFLVFLAGSLLLITGLTTHASAQDITGEALAQKVFDRDRGIDSVSRSQMVLIDKNGRKLVRMFKVKRVRQDGLERQLLQFTEPADINGTGFLTLEKQEGETEQFLYLPALKRTRRIVSSQKAHRFVNSDFTYEDMERHPVSDFTYQITGSAKLENIDCHVLESRPGTDVESQYSLTVSLISKQGFVPLQVKYFDKENTHIKTYTVMKLDQIQGIWTEMILHMEDLENKHQTYIKQEKITYNTGIDPDTINRNSLETN